MFIRAVSPLLLLLVSLSVGVSNSYCQELNPNSNSEISRKIEEHYVIADSTGSHLAYVVASLLSHKYPDEAKRVTPLLESIKYRLSPLTLGGAAQGGLSWSDSGEFSDEVGLLTGKRAIDETLQLDSIDQNIPAWRQTPTIDRNEPEVELSTIEPLTVKSHPWEEMQKGLTRAEIPPIVAFAPRDNFTIYFSSLAKFNDLEKGLKELTLPLTEVFSLERALNIKDKIKERLGLKKLEIFEPLVKEVLFISEDLDFYPSTHYAVVLSFNAPLVSTFSDYITPGKAHAEMVGDNLVIATSETLLSKIKAAKSSPDRSLASTGELLYALSVLEKNRDGFVYLSEDFILKMVSASYRINSGRRNAVLRKVEALQYAVFAYRSITGKWPSKLSDLATEGYLASHAIEPLYSVDEKGIVHHETWDSLYNVKAVSDIALSSVKKSEKERYDRFREGYQSFWREFFDPVGVAITVGDQLYFQTVILPLIDNSEYRDLKKFLGGSSKELKSLKSIRRLPAFSLITSMQPDQLLLENVEEFVGYNEREKVKALSDDEKKKILNEEFSQKLELKSTFDLFGILGEEFVIGADGDQSFSIQNLADVDVFVGLELKDPARFKEFVNKVYQVIYREISRDSHSAIPFFKLSAEEPLQNEYKGVKYYLVPTGFVNLYFVYLDNFVYFAISQLSINRLIDAGGQGISNASPYQKRAIDYIGRDGNALFLVDAVSAQKLSKNLSEAWMSPLNIGRIAAPFAGYLSDIDILIRGLGDSGDLNHYFPFVPTTIVGAKVTTDKTGVLIGDQTRVALKEIDYGQFNFHFAADWVKEYKPKNAVEFSTLQAPDFIGKLVDGIGKLKDFAVMFKFTEHGVDTRVVLNNPTARVQDKRFSETIPAPKAKSSDGVIAGAVDLRLVLLVSVLIVFGVVVYLIRRTRPQA